MSKAGISTLCNRDTPTGTLVFGLSVAALASGTGLCSTRCDASSHVYVSCGFIRGRVGAVVACSGRISLIRLPEGARMNGVPVVSGTATASTALCGASAGGKSVSISAGGPSTRLRLDAACLARLVRCAGGFDPESRLPLPFRTLRDPALFLLPSCDPGCRQASHSPRSDRRAATANIAA